MPNTRPLSAIIEDMLRAAFRDAGSTLSCGGTGAVLAKTDKGTISLTALAEQMTAELDGKIEVAAAPATPEDHGRIIDEAVDTVNSLVREAAEAGVRTEISSLPIQQMGKPSFVRLSAHTYKPLGRNRE